MRRRVNPPNIRHVVVPADEVVGARYPAPMMAMLDSEK